MNTFEYIKSDRLLLKRPTESDFERYFQINNDPETNVFNPYGPMNREIASEIFGKVIEHWKAHTFGIWTIHELKNPDYAIGFGGLSNRLYGEENKLNLGFRFDTQYWGKGYATEFAKAAIQKGFTILEVSEIFGLVRPNNLASIKVLEKCGMIPFGEIDDIPNEDPSYIFKIINPNLK